MARATRVERRKWPRREVNFLVQLIYPTRGIREVHSATFPLQTISEDGASIDLGMTKTVPDFFYMQFDADIPAELIGCYLVARDDHVVRCQFDPIIPTEKVNEIIARKSMRSILDSLFEPSKDELIGELSNLLGVS